MPKFLYRKLERFLDKSFFQEKPLRLTWISLGFNSIIVLSVYLALFFLIPERLSASACAIYLVNVALITVLLSLFYLKNDFFSYFSHDHFFNLLGDHQSEFIIKRIRGNYSELIIRFFIPFSLPAAVHLSFVKGEYLSLAVVPLLGIFAYQFIAVFSALIWYLSILFQRNFLLKILMFLVKAGCALTVFGLFLLSLGAVLQPEGVDFEVENPLIFQVTIAGVLIVLNLLLRFFHNLDSTIINQSYRKIIYFEGYKKTKDRSLSKSTLLERFLNLGTVNLNKREKAVYQKDVKGILRRKHGRVYAYLIGLALILAQSLGFVSLQADTAQDYLQLNFYIVNGLLALSLGVFQLVHKTATSLSIEGVNHEIYNRTKVGFQEVFKAKLYLNRFIAAFPFLIYFTVLFTQTQSLPHLGANVLILLYFWGMLNLVIQAKMLEDFFNPQFAGSVYTNPLEKRSESYIDYYSFFFIYAFLIFPLTITELLKVTNIWVVMGVIVILIYLALTSRIRKSQRLKKVSRITYGGVTYVKG